MATLSDISASVTKRLKESATDATTLARVYECVNMAYIQICSDRDWPFLRVNNKKLPGNGTRAYPVESETSKVINVRYGTSPNGESTIKLTKVDKNDILLNPKSAGSTPEHYCISEEGFLELDIEISSSFNIYYDYTVSADNLVNTSDLVLIPDKFCGVLKQLAYYYALDADNDSRAENAYNLYRQMYFKMISNAFFNGDEDTVMRSGYENWP